MNRLALEKAKEIGAMLIDQMADEIYEEALERHANEQDMTFAINFKWPAKSHSKIVGALRYSTPVSVEITGEIEDPNQPALFGEEEDEA